MSKHFDPKRRAGSGALSGWMTPLPSARLFGYAMGGSPGYSSTTNRITFATEVFAANTSSDCTVLRTYAAGLSDAVRYGYAVSGYNVGGEQCAVDRVDLTTSVTSGSSGLTLGRHYLGAVGDSVAYGYASGGAPAAYTAITERLTFATSRWATSTVSNLSIGRMSLAGMHGGATYGYFLGGYTTSAAVATADRITWATSATAARTAADLTTVRCNVGVVNDGTTYGYACGGTTTGATDTGKVVTCDRLTFSTSATAARTAADLSAAKVFLTGISSGLYGYLSGGYTSGAATVATTDRLTFSTSATAAYTTANLPATQSDAAGVSGFPC